MDNLVDAVRPDPPSRHEVALLVRELLKSPKTNSDARAQLNAMFQSWIAAAPKVEAQMDHSPLLAVARPRAVQLAQLGRIGQESLEYLGGKKAPAVWKQTSLAELDAAGKPQVLVLFTVIDPLRDLVNAVK
jgi:hexosaminidase